MRQIAADRAMAPTASRTVRPLLAAIAVLGVGAPAGAAPATASLRVLILLGSEEHRELASRVEGQTADLSAVVASAEGSALPADLDGQLAVVRAVRGRADVVIWFGADGGGARSVYIARGERVLARRIEVAPGTLSRSAASEAVALAVRTALIGFAAEDRAGDSAERDASVRGWAALGWSGLLDRSGSSGHHGVAVRAGAARGRWRLGAAFSVQQVVAVRSTSASFDVGRQQLGVVLGADLAGPGLDPAARWSLGLELVLGAIRFPRTTTATASGLVATPAAATWSAAVSPGVRAARRLSSRTWLALEVGADLLGAPPRFDVQGNAGVERIASFWALQPRVALSALLDWP